MTIFGFWFEIKMVIGSMLTMDTSVWNRKGGFYL